MLNTGNPFGLLNILLNIPREFILFYGWVWFSLTNLSDCIDLVWFFNLSCLHSHLIFRQKKQENIHILLARLSILRTSCGSVDRSHPLCLLYTWQHLLWKFHSSYWKHLLSVQTMYIIEVNLRIHGISFNYWSISVLGLIIANIWH